MAAYILIGYHTSLEVSDRSEFAPEALTVAELPLLEVNKGVVWNPLADEFGAELVPLSRTGHVLISAVQK